MKQYKLTVDFGKGPFVQYILARDEDEAKFFCAALADSMPFADVIYEEVTVDG